MRICDFKSERAKLVGSVLDNVYHDTVKYLHGHIFEELTQDLHVKCLWGNLCE